MDKLLETVGVILGILILVVVVGTSVGLSLMFLGWVWLGVESVWGMIF